MEDEENVVDYLSELAEPTAAWLQRKFPSTSAETVEDAVQDALVHALENPDVYRNKAASAKSEAKRLFRTIAWRTLRGQLRRKGNRTTQLPELSDAGPSQFDLVAASELQGRALSLLPEVLAGFRNEHRPKLEQAFLEKLQSLEGDADLARRHGVRREYLGSIRRKLAKRLRTQGSPEW